MQRQSHIGRRAQRQVWRDLHFLQIDVGLIESVEQYETVYIERVQTGRHVCQTTEVRTQLYRERDFGGSANTANNVGVDIFDGAAGDVRTSRYFVDVQFQRVGARLGDSSRVADPAAERRAIEAGNDWNPDRSFRLRDVFKISVWIDAEFRRSSLDLLFEQRMKNHCGSAGLFHRRTLSIFSESGEADGTSGDRRESPRYFVVRSMGYFRGLTQESNLHRLVKEQP